MDLFSWIKPPFMRSDFWVSRTQRLREGRSEMADSKLKTVIILSTLIMAIAVIENTRVHGGEIIPPSEIWSALFQRMPYPYTIPLALEESTAIDGTYIKIELKDTPPIPCRRCPDYAPEGGIWKVNFNKGVFRIMHSVTGWKSIGTFILSGDQLILANDPTCQEVIGAYTWRLEKGALILKVIEDHCAIGLRAKNLAGLPWLSCQPPSTEAATTDHWPKPAGCDD